MSRLTQKLLTKIAADASDFPITVTANDVRVELISQFDWFKDIPKEQLDQIIDNTPKEEYQAMADDVNEKIAEQAMKNNAVKGLYAHRLAREIRYGLARALYLPKTAIVVQLEDDLELLSPSLRSYPLLFSRSLYTARILKQLQDEGYIKYSDEYMREHKDDPDLELPLDRLIEARINRIIAEAHETAMNYVLQSQLLIKVRNNMAEKRLDIVTNEFWVNKGLR